MGLGENSGRRHLITDFAKLHHFKALIFLKAESWRSYTLFHTFLFLLDINSWALVLTRSFGGRSLSELTREAHWCHALTTTALCFSVTDELLQCSVKPLLGRCFSSLQESKERCWLSEKASVFIHKQATAGSRALPPKLWRSDMYMFKCTPSQEIKKFCMWVKEEVESE